MRNNALVVVDMLYDFIDGSLRSGTLIRRQKDREERNTRSSTHSRYSSFATIILPTIHHSWNMAEPGLHIAWQGHAEQKSMTNSSHMRGKN